MKKIVRLTESDLVRLISRVIKEQKTIKEDVSSFDSLKTYIPKITLKILKDCLTANTVVVSKLPFELLQQSGTQLKQSAIKVDNGTANDRDVRDVAFGLIGLTGMLMGDPIGQKLNDVMVCLKDKMMSQM